MRVETHEATHGTRRLALELDTDRDRHVHGRRETPVHCIHSVLSFLKFVFVLTLLSVIDPEQSLSHHEIRINRSIQLSISRCLLSVPPH